MKKKKDKPEQPTGKANNVIVLNPPEKAPPRSVNERVSLFFQKRYQSLAEKNYLVIQAKAKKAQIEESILQIVFQRGLSSYTPRPNLTREQYAMNRVNSFIAGGITLIEDSDLLPIHEAGGADRPHIVVAGNAFHIVDNKGSIVHTVNSEAEARAHLSHNFQKYVKEEFVAEAGSFDVNESVRGTVKAKRPGTGGAARPHVKKETDPYNPNKVTYVVYNSKGVQKLKTQDEKQAYDHLRANYQKYLREGLSRKDPRSRFEGTNSLVKIYKKDTPGEDVKEEKMKGDDPCWSGYEMVGHKKKSGRKVPNCVPRNEETSAEKKYHVQYDIYHRNREKPLYTNTRVMRATHEKQAIERLRRLIGGSNHRIVKTEEN